MSAKGSIPPMKRRRCFHLSRHTVLLVFLIVLASLPSSHSLRTSGSKKRTRYYDLRSEFTRTISALLNPVHKERRLSVLNHPLSLLGGKVGPKLRIASKIYSLQADRATGTEEISVLDVPQNSDLVVGKDVPKRGKVVLECLSEHGPVSWQYNGDGAPQMQTNTTIPARKKAKYSAIAMIGSDEGTLEGKETGEYICKSTQNPEESIRYYIFVPGKSHFIRRGGVIRLSPSDTTLRIPCSVTNPEARVTILKSNKGYLTCVTNETLSYSKKTGFTMNLVEDDERNDASGSYVCLAGINNSYQIAEYSVIRSFENSTFEYNWDEQSPFYDDDLSELGRNDDVCQPNPCGANSVCEGVHNRRTGDPFTCRCQEGFRGKPPRCRSSSLCDSSPCGPFSVCTEDPQRNYPRCACQPNYIGRPPNCRPECTLDDDCHPSFTCVNNTCQNPCLRACALDAICTVQNHQARCSCPIGTAGDPSNGGKCIRIRVPSVQFFPTFFGYNARPRPTLAPSVQPGDPIQIFPGDSLLQSDLSEEYSSIEYQHQRNPCDPWPCGPYSQCTPVGEYAHCKCNVGFVGLPPNCHPECRRDSECSSMQTCIDNQCKNPCAARGRIRCGEGATCRGRNHQAECVCPNGFRGDPLVRCTPSSSESAESQSQESPGMWGSSGPRPPPSNPQDSTEEASGGQQSTQNTRPAAGRPPKPSQRPKPSNPQHGGSGTGRPPSDESGDSSCSNYCGKNAICVKRNQTVTCRCKPGYTGPGSDPYTECTPSRNPCARCGQHSTCQVMGNGSPICQCQPGKVGSPPNCRDNVCRTNRDCPADRTCKRKSCVDPCQPQHTNCGSYAECRAINHSPVCACPNHPDKDPLDEGGCPPPGSSLTGRPRHPDFFPPTRFFI